MQCLTTARVKLVPSSLDMREVWNGVSIGIWFLCSVSLAAYLQVFRDAPWLKSCCRPPPPRHRLLTPFRRTSSSSFFVRFSDSTDTLSCGYCVFSLTLLSITPFFMLGQLTIHTGFHTGLLVVSRLFWFSLRTYVLWERSTAASWLSSLCRCAFFTVTTDSDILRKMAITGRICNV